MPRHRRGARDVAASGRCAPRPSAMRRGRSLLQRRSRSRRARRCSSASWPRRAQHLVAATAPLRLFRPAARLDRAVVSGSERLTADAQAGRCPVIAFGVHPRARPLRRVREPGRARGRARLSGARVRGGRLGLPRATTCCSTHTAGHADLEALVLVARGHRDRRPRLLRQGPRGARRPGRRAGRLRRRHRRGHRRLVGGHRVSGDGHPLATTSTAAATSTPTLWARGRAAAPRSTRSTAACWCCRRGPSGRCASTRRCT